MRSSVVTAQFRRFALYVACGGLGVAVDLAIYWVMISAGIWYQSANAAGYAAGTLVSFLLNRAITFRVRDAVLRRAISFASVAAVGYGLSAIVLWLLAERLHLDLLIAKLLGLVVVLTVQFSLNSLITFRTRAQATP